MIRFLVRLATAVTALALFVVPALAFNETGGSGLLRIEEAYSLPIGRPLFSIHGGLFSNNFTPGTSRMISATPSVTLGLGGGFEAAGSVSFEGLTSAIEDGSFDRRFDFRRRALETKLRWTTDIGSPRLRAGLLGNLTLPVWIRDRPGALYSPDKKRDVGIMGLVSTNIGWFDVPVRLHLNAGYWWSRNDGAFIYRSLPTAIPVMGADPNRNDVFEYGLAIEAGLRRAVVFVELRSEQFVDARGALSSRENLWQLTPGFKTELSSTLGLTGGISFDLSSDDAGTAFDPSVAFPKVELKVGLTLGSVLSRNSHELARRNDNTPVAPAVASASVPDQAPAVEARMPAPDQPVAPAVTDAMRIKELEERLARIETAQRLAYLEARLSALEGRPGAAGTSSPLPGAVPPKADAGKAPVASAATPSSPAAKGARPVVAASPATGLEVGVRRRLNGVPMSAATALSALDGRAELDALAADLAARPSVGVAVLAHGGGGNRSAALALTDSVAAMVQNYLLEAGAPAGSVIPIGMGTSESPVPVVEIERIR